MNTCAHKVMHKIAYWLNSLGAIPFVSFRVRLSARKSITVHKDKVREGGVVCESHNWAEK